MAFDGGGLADTVSECSEAADGRRAPRFFFEPTDLDVDAAWDTIGTGVQTKVPGGRLQISGPQLTVALAAIASTTLLVRNLLENDDDSITREAVRQCFTQIDLNNVPLIDGRHPCEIIPIYLPGSDVATATQHRADAINANASFRLLSFVPANERRAELTTVGTITSRAWYRNDPRCEFGTNPPGPETADDKTQCDEYPNFASNKSGPPDASLRRINSLDNASEGGIFSFFTRICEPVTRRLPFLVIPMTFTLGDPDSGIPSDAVGPPSFWLCNDVF